MKSNKTIEPKTVLFKDNLRTSYFSKRKIAEFVSKASNERQSKQKSGDVRVYVEHFLTED